MTPSRDGRGDLSDVALVTGAPGPRALAPAFALAALLLGTAPASAQQAPFSLDDRFEGLLDRIDELETSVETLRAERDELRTERRALRARALADAEARARDRDLADRLDAALARNAELEAALEGRSAELDAVRAVVEQGRGEIETSRDAAEAAHVAVEAARAEADAAARAQARVREELRTLRELRARLERAEAERDRTVAERESAVAALDGARVEAATVRAELDVEGDAAPGEPCDDTILSNVEGVVARLVVVNPCRAEQRLSVRSARPTDPLLGQLRTRFDAEGRAELTFPVLEPETRLRVLGAERGDWHDVELSPDSDPGTDIAVLRWEDGRVDLDLVAVPVESEEALAPRGDGEAPADGLGELELAQGADEDTSGAQLPRFEVFVAAADAPSLELGVDHASRGDVAEPPSCGESEAADPRLLLVLRQAGALEQTRTALASLPCGTEVPAERRVTRLRTLG